MQRERTERVMDANEFKRRFLPCHQKLYRVAFRLMGNVQDAEDMVQETYLRLWKKREELPPDIGSMEAYSVAIIRNLCLDALKAPQMEEEQRPIEELDMPQARSLVREVELKDEASIVRRIIGDLPEQQRQLVKMRDVDDCSYEEIEQVTGLTAVNIRVLLSRARKKIREQFNAIGSYEYGKNQ